MPPKQCAKCTKTVYPTEELKCLDKVWHKGCFKCDVCNMTLNMKNYKGYNKLPYCNAHYPQTKFTSVADTPENRRLTKNTAQQSNIKYHEEFEKQKGKKITVADDPEVLRVKRNMDVVSNISYHGDRDKKQEMERIRPAEQVEGHQPYQPYDRRSSDMSPEGGGQELEAEDKDAGRHRQNPGRIADYDPEERFAGVGANMGGTPYSNRNSAGARQVYDSSVGKAHQRALASQAQQRYYKDEIVPTSPTSPGRVDAGRRISHGSVRNRVERFSSSGDDEHDPGLMEQPQVRKVGSIHDYDPLNDKYGSVAGQNAQDSRRAQPPPQQQQPYQPPPPQFQPPAPAEPPQQKDKNAGKGMVCQALYDYDAADADEVSFKDGDLIVFCQPIDAGWMEGVVEKTGQRGMLPSNYVEKI